MEFNFSFKAAGEISEISLRTFPKNAILFPKGNAAMTDQEFISTKEAACILELSDRRIVGLCNQQAFEGARKDGRNWKIPKEAVLAYRSDMSPKRENERKLSCAVGSTSYPYVVENSYYVDNPLLIRDLIDDRIPVILFTRPRGFGKTLAMDMLKSFFEKSVEDTSVFF